MGCLEIFATVVTSTPLVMFPIVSTKSTTSPSRETVLLSALLIHSLLITSTTPLIRLIYGRWYGQTPLHKLYAFIIGQVDGRKLQKIRDLYVAYPTMETSPLIDRAFGLHAAFSLLWVVTGYLVLVVTPRWSRPSHKRAGCVAIAIFLAHLAAGIHNLWADIVKHHPFPKALLLVTAILNARSMLSAVTAARDGNFARHRRFMLRTYVLSLEGAGTVRTVEFIQWLAGVGNSGCQERHGGLLTNCLWPYVLRLVLTRLLTLIYLHCLARATGEKELARTQRRELLCWAAYSSAILIIAVLGLEGAVGVVLNGGGMASIAVLEMFRPGFDEEATGSFVRLTSFLPLTILVVYRNTASRLRANIQLFGMARGTGRFGGKN